MSSSLLEPTPPGVEPGGGQNAPTTPDYVTKMLEERDWTKPPMEAGPGWLPWSPPNWAPSQAAPAAPTQNPPNEVSEPTSEYESVLSPDEEALQTRLRDYLEGRVKEKINPWMMASMALKALYGRSIGQPVMLADLIREHEATRTAVAEKLLNDLTTRSAYGGQSARWERAQELQDKRLDARDAALVWRARENDVDMMERDGKIADNPEFAASAMALRQAIQDRNESAYNAAKSGLAGHQQLWREREKYKTRIDDPKTLRGLYEGYVTPNMVRDWANKANVSPAEVEATLAEHQKVYDEGARNRKQLNDLRQANENNEQERLNLQREEDAFRKRLQTFKEATASEAEYQSLAMEAERIAAKFATQAAAVQKTMNLQKESMGSGLRARIFGVSDIDQAQVGVYAKNYEVLTDSQRRYEDMANEFRRMGAQRRREGSSLGNGPTTKPDPAVATNALGLAAKTYGAVLGMAPEELVRRFNAGELNGQEADKLIDVWSFLYSKMTGLPNEELYGSQLSMVQPKYTQYISNATTLFPNSQLGVQAQANLEATRKP